MFVIAKGCALMAVSESEGLQRGRLGLYYPGKELFPSYLLVTSWRHEGI